jgi:hypothetical protein
MGEMLQAAKGARQITKAHNPKNKHDVPNGNIMISTLAQWKIPRKLSSSAQRLDDLEREDSPERERMSKILKRPVRQ